jgi:putative phosphoesterase
MATRVGVVADTHIHGPSRILPPALWSVFGGVQMILHAGDLVTLDVLGELGTLCPVHAVHGNCDPLEVVARLPPRRVVEVEGVRIGLTHGHLGPGSTTAEKARRAFSDVHCVVFGHSHEPLNHLRGGVLLFNPGSAVERRRQPRTSCGILHVEGGAIRGELIWL